jgi:hypothetical protein
VLSAAPSALIICCGALAREIKTLIRLNQWHHITLTALPAELHNHPEQIPEAIRQKIGEGRKQFRTIFAAYADCGTGGVLDQVLKEEGVERLPGVHCYGLYAGESRFQSLQEQTPGNFYLTDFLVKHFQRLVVESLGIDRYPELKSLYFNHYTQVVYFSQQPTEALLLRAREIADQLLLDFTHVETGLRGMEKILEQKIPLRESVNLSLNLDQHRRVV